MGWDCHGLPVEYEIDKALNITVRPIDANRGRLCLAVPRAARMFCAWA